MKRPFELVDLLTEYLGDPHNNESLIEPIIEQARGSWEVRDTYWGNKPPGRDFAESLRTKLRLLINGDLHA